MPHEIRSERISEEFWRDQIAYSNVCQRMSDAVIAISCSSDTWARRLENALLHFLPLEATSFPEKFRPKYEKIQNKIKALTFSRGGYSDSPARSKSICVDLVNLYIEMHWSSLFAFSDAIMQIDKMSETR